ncbi:motility accessory factor [Campylobacter insulaenigrae]|uniref:DUF2920 family protein n=1 Tax=Campylobacter insulaenigrae TaxID=260714 RepID=UPI000F70C6FE|nr:DUF2920 family protein [Campylobacter insulaenigrae]MCR6591937.1 DUF2920 family protein [Campylobacter insulaenigrae]MCR6593470.1 DUF2920 family protein [Campylobacter insulaenigrae]VEJ55102.1 motility accessory factor [Campylobacter insulaenigrae]
MLVDKTYFIDSCDDVELNIKRESKLEFRLAYDDEKEIEAVICMIPGLGGDIHNAIFGFDMKYFVLHYNVAVLSVSYHCLGNRPQIGAKFYLDDIDKLIFDTSLKAINLDIPYDIQSLNTFEDFFPAMNNLNSQIQNLKNDWKLDKNYFLDLSVSLQPTKNEYQNYGIMQVVDILNALLYIKKNPPFKIMSGVCRLLW